MIKKLWAVLIGITISTYTLAESSGLSLSLPSTSQSYGQDSIRSGDIDCKNSIGGATNLEFGMTSIIDNYEPLFGSGNHELDRETRDVGVYARIVIPLDAPKERINCNSLYQLELRKRRLEVLRLQEELEALRRLNSSGKNGFEN